ncbi:hypothetical protein BX600DRAFT_462429 [Xylariales sp. PMI_506]|nr:hypothetical protein BX600DRAFT_462429 [Xylariales sp. PMI_506]
MSTASVVQESENRSGLGVGTSNKDDYVLGRGYAASTRLNLQHYLWREAQGFLVHPWVREELHKKAQSAKGGSQTLEIADLATGTGIWLLDLHRSSELSDVKTRLQGFDISPSLFPHKAWLPKSISFDTSNLLMDPPEELLGSFDYVHLRLVISVTTRGDPRQIIRHIFKLLKPGGLLQWDELDILGHHHVLAAGTYDAESTNMNAVFDVVRKSGDYTWVPKLPELLEGEGFEAASQKVYDPSPETFRAWTCAELGMTEEISWNFLKGESGTQMRQRILSAYEEANNDAIGAVLKSCPTVTIARKPAGGSTEKATWGQLLRNLAGI